MTFYEELKRRNVFRVSAAYLVLSWLIVQVTGAVVPALHLPDSIPSTVVWLCVIGFPFVVVFSWVYELTPEGLKREGNVDRAASITHLTGRRLDYITIALLLVAFGLFAFQYFRPPPGETPARSETAESGEVVPSIAETPAATDTPAVPADDKSIAVLPFADMSQAKDQEYMSDGIAEELLNQLAQVPGLKVIARTSSFAFKGQNVEIAEIAKKLNVAHVLEGSVRKSGNTLRITAQLVRTADSTHLWSETYDRPMDDVFAVQDEIADAIVQALQIRLTGGELNLRKGGTQNLVAYQLFLRARSNLGQITRASLEEARVYLEQAIKLDPNYGLAWVALASYNNLLAESGFQNVPEGFERARQMAQHALALSPDLAPAHSVLAYVHRAFDWNWAAAEREIKQALAIDPTNPAVLVHAGILSYTLGRWDDAERQLRAALNLDPLNPITNWNLGFTYYLSGRFEESEGMYRKVFDLAPDFLWTRAYLGKTLLAQDKVEEALEVVQKEADEGWRLAFLPILLQAAGHPAEAEEALKAQIAYWSDTGASYIAQTHAYRGDHDLALQWLERAYVQKDPGLTEIVGEPLFKNLADDPRFKAFLRKMGLPEITSGNMPLSPNSLQASPSPNADH